MPFHIIMNVFVPFFHIFIIFYISEKTSAITKLLTFKGKLSHFYILYWQSKSGTVTKPAVRYARYSRQKGPAPAPQAGSGPCKISLRNRLSRSPLTRGYAAAHGTSHPAARPGNPRRALRPPGSHGRSEAAASHPAGRASGLSRPPSQSRP